MKARILSSGVGFAEGPILLRDGNLVVTSLDHGCLYRIVDGRAEVFADTGGGPNGATEGLDGVYVAQSGGQWAEHRPPFTFGMSGGIQRVADGVVEWCTMDPIAPSDLCFGPDGLLYFTDASRRRFDDGRLWRMDVGSGELELLCSVPWFTNGIGFGPEAHAVYVASTGAQELIRLPLTPAGLGNPEVVVHMKRGNPDGFAFDVAGHVTIAAMSFDDRPSTIQTWDVGSGTLIDMFELGDSWRYTNVALSEDRLLIVTDASNGTVLGFDDWPVPGLLLHPFRSP